MHEQTFPNKETAEIVGRFYEAKAPVEQTLGMLLSRVHPQQYETNGTAYNHWAQRSMLRAFKCTERACWPLHVTLVNARVGPHVDASDSPWAMVAMVASGDFTGGGNIICPQLGKQHALREKGVWSLVARLVHHYVGSYEGTRISRVHAMHETLYSLKAAVQSSEAKLERKRQREAMEPTAELDASRGYVLCPFCQRHFGEESRLKQHLAKWLKEVPAEDDEHHKAARVREWAEGRKWKPPNQEQTKKSKKAAVLPEVHEGTSQAVVDEAISQAVRNDRT